LIQGAADHTVAIILSIVAVALYQGIRRALIAPISQYDKTKSAFNAFYTTACNYHSVIENPSISHHEFSEKNEIFILIFFLSFPLFNF